MASYDPKIAAWSLILGKEFGNAFESIRVNNHIAINKN